ncbi:hypothetical protein [Actinoplanes sp. NPDC051411]|uniref:hypothetical protein n=1 Tax=Actinoplanes sp. NPDC051411 TaxID=3155522 RepID=UPI00344A62EA
MSAPGAAVTGLCFRCGGPVAPGPLSCPYCGMPLITPPPPAAVEPPAPIMTAGPTLTAGPPGPRRLGWRPLVAIGVVLILLIGGGVAAATVRLTRPGAAGTVRDYFAALSGGHAARALRYVNSSAQFTADRYPLLSDAGLTETAARPSAVHVGAVAAIEGAPVDARSVKVNFRAGGTPVQETLVVLHSNGAYLIQSPFIEVAVANAAGRKVTVNGVALGGQQLNTLAFPGGYHAVAAANQLLGGSQATSTLRPGPNLPLAPIDLGTPTLAPGALAEIQKQVRAAIDACATGGQALPQGCPFGLNIPGTPTAVRWTVNAYPTVDAQVTPSLFGVVVAVGGPGGKVHWDVSYTGVAGDQRHESGDSDFTVNGSATQTATGIQVSLVG